MEGHSVISPDVLARYAADAAAEVPGGTAVIETPLQRRGVKVAGDEVEVHLLVDCGVIIPMSRPRAGTASPTISLRMADVRPAAVNVVVDEVARP